MAIGCFELTLVVYDWLVVALELTLVVYDWLLVALELTLVVYDWLLGCFVTDNFDGNLQWLLLYLYFG